MLHEMVHQWQAETGLRIDHGRTFRQKAREVGVIAGGEADGQRGSGACPERSEGTAGQHRFETA